MSTDEEAASAVAGASTGRPTALVIGGSAIEVVRSLQLADIPCSAVVPHGDATRFSRANLAFEWDWTRPDEAHDEQLADRLVHWARSQPDPPVLFACSDQAMVFNSRYRDRLASAFRFTIPDAKLVEALADKGQFAELAGRLSLPVPATRVLPIGGDCPDLGELGFPLIIKPERRDRAWRHVEETKVKALLMESAEELRRNWPKLAALDKTLVAQQYIAGPESAIESYHVYVDRRGGIAAEFTGKKIRTYPVHRGFTTSCRITDERDVLDAGRALVELLGLRGVAKFDFKRAPGGRLYLFEINARTSLWMHPGARAGVNIPAFMYADLAGVPRPVTNGRPLPVTWVHPKDVLAARECGMPVAEWLRFAAGCRAKGFWLWSDPMPFVGMALSRVRTGDFS